MAGDSSFAVAPSFPPFVMLFLERSGSSHLAMLLAQHPEIHCHGELFDARNGIRDPALPTAESALLQLGQIYCDETKARGFKFKSPTQVQAYPEVLARLREVADRLRVLCLVRRDPLRSMISKQVQLGLFSRTGRANLAFDDPLEIGPIVVDVPRLMRRLPRRVAAMTRLEELAAQFPQRLTVEYAALCHHPHETWTRITRFLGGRDSALPPSRLRKMIPDDLALALANYDEVASALRGTEFECYLRPGEP